MYNLANFQRFTKILQSFKNGQKARKIGVYKISNYSQIFVYVLSHKENEEIYIVLDGKGLLFVDGVETEIKKGDCFRIDPKGQRCLKAAADSVLQYLCIQTKANSLEHFTMTDGVMSEDMAKPSWL